MRALAVFITCAAAVALGLARPSAAEDTSHFGTCPPEAVPELVGVPPTLPWGSRASVQMFEPSGGQVVSFRVARADTGEVIAGSAEGRANFELAASHPAANVSFVLSWDAMFYAFGDEARFCSGSLAVSVASGLDTAIRVNSTLAGVRLGDTDERVRQVLGAPASSTRGVYRYPQWGLRVALVRGKVRSVRTTSRTFRTPSGIGVGSTFAQLRRRQHVACRGLQARGPQTCVARPRTVFSGRGGRVVEVALTLSR